MAIGLYTGGTPNLNAIGNIFGVEGSLIARANLSDMIIGAVFYLFLLTICKPLLRKVLKPAGDAVYLTKKSEIVNKEELNLKELRHYKSLIFTTVLAVLMVTGGALLRVVVWITGGRPEGKLVDIMVPPIMITVTLLEITASLFRRVRGAKGTNIIGQY